MKLAVKILMIIVVLAAGGYYLWAQTSYLDFIKPRLEKLCCIKDETAGWKTYRNEKYEFSFDYPANRELIIETQPGKGPDLLLSISDDPDNNVQIFIATRERLSEKLYDYEKTSNIIPYHYENIGKYKVIVRNDIFGGMGPLEDSYTVILEKAIVELGILRTDENHDLVNRIISTFEFIR